MRVYSDDKDVQRVATHLPDPRDLILFVLKAHLLVETTLREIVQARCERTSALDAAQLSFWNLLHVAESLTSREDEAPSWVWKAARTLNATRNQLTHKLEPKGVKEKLQGLIAAAERRAWRSDIESDNSWEGRLSVAIGFLIGDLANIRDGVTHG